tara:strand:- start:421 stop:597 length:177 start_codon:yes stop_codon:yes gene_type:complete
MIHYIVEFTYTDGTKEQVEFNTDRGLQWTIDQWSRNRAVVKSELINESATSSKRMLLD